MAKSKLKIEFGKPESGWLPVVVKYGDFELKFRASHIPINPIDQLISAIRQITKGIGTDVWWHLEPDGYYFNFEKKGEEFFLTMYHSAKSTSNKELIYSMGGTYEDMIMPFYRSLKNFFTQSIDDQHWPETEEKEIQALTRIVKGG